MADHEHPTEAACTGCTWLVVGTQTAVVLEVEDHVGRTGHQVGLRRLTADELRDLEAADSRKVLAGCALVAALVAGVLTVAGVR